MIAPTYEGIVRDLLQARLNDTLNNSKFNSEVIRPLRIEEIIDKPVKNLSGGELQRVALVLALGKPAEVYLIDEPSAYLDAEQRVMTARLIKRYVMNAKKAALIVEHDFIMATYLADK
jgi:ATP-binding cassette subfamily E protein 1